MCGRFVVALPADAMARLFDAAPANDLPETPNFNVCPTTQIHAVVTEGQRRLSALRWGFLPSWYKTPTDGPLLINARAETLAEKPAFRAAARMRRCLIPASGFYEWTKSEEGARLPWYITATTDAPLIMAGVWQDWTSPETGEALRCCAIVTTTASADIDHIHHRMPVLLGLQDCAKWLGEQGKGAARLMQPAAEGSLVAHRVSPSVNSNRASGIELTSPL